MDKREQIKLAENKLQECKEAFVEMLEGDVYMEDDVVANIFEQADDEIEHAYERHPETSKNVSNEVYIVIHEYSDRDYQGSDVCSIYYDEEKAIQKAKTYAENVIEGSNYDESEISYHDNGRFQEIYYNDGYYDIFKVVAHEIR